MEIGIVLYHLTYQAETFKNINIGIWLTTATFTRASSDVLCYSMYI